jgi:hypothetical protein
MIDVSPLLLWTADEVLELMPIDSADSPRARRLAVLAAEAQSAGHGAAVLAWMCDVARALLLDVAPAAERAALMNAVLAAEAVVVRGEPLAPEARSLLAELCEREASLGSAAAAATSALAAWTLGVANRLPFSGVQAWHTATELLAVIAKAAGDVAEPTIARCAELAYKRLFTDGIGELP